MFSSNSCDQNNDVKLLRENCVPHTGIGSHCTSILLRVLDLLSYTGSAVHTVTFGDTIWKQHIHRDMSVQL